MSFVLDVIALAGIGYLTGRIFTVAVVLGGRLMDRKSWERTILSTGVLAVGIFWLFGVLLYLDVIRAAGMTGDGFMWNYPINFGIARSPSNDILALLIGGIGYPTAYGIGHLFGWAASKAHLRLAADRARQYLPDLIEGSGPEEPPIDPAEWKEASERALAYLGAVPGSFRTSVEVLIEASVLFLVPRLVPGKRPLLWRTKRKDRVAYFRDLNGATSPALGNIKLIFKSITAVAIFSKGPGWRLAEYPGPPLLTGLDWHDSSPFVPESLEVALDALRPKSA